ncbi:unnamed protein product [Mycena citricolor]|uniref:THUMP domain-containing protein n=1 Tax=Mycena citricolor TaxID=2018698 RepID=A0AAD2H5V8_9AGAR|nr:unnamed protein product [Mycena citricolor]
MSGAAKRSSASQGGSDRRKKKYRSDGTPIWGKRFIDGPGIWVTCAKGKEKQAVGEIYDLFNTLAEEMWPEKQDAADTKSDDAEDEEELSIEAQIANEVSAMKKPKAEQRFANCQTNTPCLIFISCKSPVDPVALVMRYLHDVAKTGITRTRHCLRFCPVSASSVTNMPEIEAVCRKLVGSPDVIRLQYKIELKMRNHTTIPRDTLIEAIAKCVPEGHSVDLSNPDVFVLVELFKSVCGVSVVREYNRLHKFNVVEIASVRAKKEDGPEETSNRIAS